MSKGVEVRKIDVFLFSYFVLLVSLSLCLRKVVFGACFRKVHLCLNFCLHGLVLYCLNVQIISHVYLTSITLKSSVGFILVLSCVNLIVCVCTLARARVCVRVCVLCVLTVLVAISFLVCIDLKMFNMSEKNYS